MAKITTYIPLPDFDKESQQFTQIRAMPVPASAELVEAARYLRVSDMQGQRAWEEIIGSIPLL
jgi:hypothetical protein